MDKCKAGREHADSKTSASSVRDASYPRKVLIISTPYQGVKRSDICQLVSNIPAEIPWKLWISV